jgi:hypothetical protein
MKTKQTFPLRFNGSLRACSGRSFPNKGGQLSRKGRLRNFARPTVKDDRKAACLSEFLDDLAPGLTGVMVQGDSQVS